ncbi:MAG: tetratricopeptide repeat protein [Candidatus Brocadia sp.]|nr:tetratricopeptide repeat protein [Candidatus Brocadia sp.]
MGKRIKSILKGFFEDDVNESEGGQGVASKKDYLAQIRNNLNKAEFAIKNLKYELAEQCLLENLEIYENLEDENEKFELNKDDITETLIKLASLSETKDKAAATYLLNLLELDPKHENANFKLGTYYFKLEKYKKAIKYFELLTKEYPNKAIYFYYLGKAYEKAEKLDDAERNFLEAVKIDSNFFSAYEGLALLYCQRGDFMNALKYFQKIKDSQDFINKHNDFLLNFGTILQVNGNYKDAKAIFEEFLGKEPENETGKLRIVEILIQEKDFQRAENYLNEILKKNPSNIEARRLLYNVYQEQGKSDMAVESSPYFYAHYTNGRKSEYSLSHNGISSPANRLIPAQTVQEQGIETNSWEYLPTPKKTKIEFNNKLMANGLVGVGLLFVFFIGSYLVLKGVISRVETMAEGMPLKLLKAYQEKIDANTKKRILARVTGNAQSYYELANYYKSQNMYNDAENYYKEAILAQPQEELPYIELAEFYKSLGRNNDAIKIYQKLFKVNPDNPKAFTEVEGYYKTLLSQQPQDENVCLELAKVYEESGREEQAIEVYQQVLTMNPNNSKANYALTKLTLNPLESPIRRGRIYHSSFLGKEKFKGELPGKSESAIETYRRTSRVDTHDSKAFEEVEDYYKNLIKAYPDVEKNYLELGKIYEQANRRDKASKVYKNLLKINKGNKTANMKLIDYYKGESPKKAVEYYENLIVMEPRQENYYLELAALYNSCGKKDRAFKIYKTLLAINPNSEKAKSEILNSMLAGIKN